jgi:hypothetical protein
MTLRHDDTAALFSSYGVGVGSMLSIRGGLHHAFVMTQGMVGVINAFVAGVFGFLLALDLGHSAAVAIASAALLLILTLGLQVRAGVSTYHRLRDSMTVHFPSPSSDTGRSTTSWMRG